MARAEAWLLEPIEDEPETAPPAMHARPVVAVFGLAEGCGATTVARALGTTLAARDPAAACTVSCSTRPAVLPLAAPAATRLARTLATLPGARAQASGRLCLVDCDDIGRLADATRHLSPLALDAGRVAVGGALAAAADQAVLVASQRVEPALAAVARATLAGTGAEPLLVLNRASEAGPFEGVADVLLPEARMGAQLAHAGHEPRGELGRAIAELADRCG